VSPFIDAAKAEDQNFQTDRLQITTPTPTPHDWSCLPTPTMSTIHLVCILDGHISPGRYSFTFPLDLSIGDLLDCVDNYHDQSACQCQNASTGVAWVANLTEYPYRKLQFDSSNIPSTMRRERADLIRSIVGVVKTSAAIHLVIEQTPRSGMSCSIPRVA